MEYGCQWAAKVRQIVYTEWWARSNDSLPVLEPSFQRDFFESRENVLMDEIRTTITGVTTRNIWKQACKERYEHAQPTPPTIMANAIWTELETAFKARIIHLEKRIKWWNYRAIVQIVDAELAVVKTTEIQGEIHFLLGLFPRDRWPRSQKATTITKPKVTTEDGFISLTPPPPQTTISSNYKWKLTTVAYKELGMLEASSSSEADEEEHKNSSSKSDSW
jgi:hypothetical protein